MQNPQNPYGNNPLPPPGPPSMVGLPSMVPPPPPPSRGDLGAESYRGRRDGSGVAAGIFLATTIHAMVVGAAVRLGGNEGNVARANTQTPQENRVIETQLLHRGGGEMDPRHIIHREAPVLQEREAPRTVTPPDPTQVHLSRDAGADEYMGAITGRRVAARGNQDLAERIRQMAAAEQPSTDPTAQGPGDPNGSNVGTTNDPNQASSGAVAKIQEFLQTRVHATQGLCGLVGEHSVMTVRVRVAEDGTISTVQMGSSSGNETLDADLLGQAQGLAENHTAIPNLTPEETTFLSSHRLNVRIPASCGH